MRSKYIDYEDISVLTYELRQMNVLTLKILYSQQFLDATLIVVDVVSIMAVVDVITFVAVVTFVVVLKLHCRNYIVQIAVYGLHHEIEFQSAQFFIRFECGNNVVTLQKT